MLGAKGVYHVNQIEQSVLIWVDDCPRDIGGNATMCGFNWGS